jgi:hypothetical protein
LKIIAFMNIVNLGVAMNFTGAKEWKEKFVMPDKQKYDSFFVQKWLEILEEFFSYFLLLILAWRGYY